MVITNKYDLPEVFVNILSKDYKGSDNYSASGMSKSPRQLWLERRHRDEIEMDVSEGLWAILGSAVHEVLNKGQEGNALTEQYLKMVIAGKNFTGMADHYKDGVISDYKFTSVWSYVFLENSLEDHKIQLNSYKLLYETAGFPVHELRIVYIFKDWSKNKIYDSGYPETPIITVEIPILKDIETRLGRKIIEHEKYRDIPDDQLPECTPGERWAKPSTWAVMREGRKSAVRVLKTEEQCLTYIATNKLDDKHYAEERRGNQFVRCEYCGGKAFCNQYADGVKGVIEDM